jgi:hypothetical protein
MCDDRSGKIRDSYRVCHRSSVLGPFVNSGPGPFLFRRGLVVRARVWLRSYSVAFICAIQAGHGGVRGGLWRSNSLLHLCNQSAFNPTFLTE